MLEISSQLKFYRISVQNLEQESQYSTFWYIQFLTVLGNFR